MCTVTLAALRANDFVLTSNRDEAPGRFAFHPMEIVFDGVKMLCPIDEEAGGTWIGVSENKRVLCLLNGGFVIHRRADRYRKSRGVMVKDLLALATLDDFIQYDFDGIEPFTLVVVDWGSGLRFCELVWDSGQLHFSDLPLLPHVWSSTTLFTREMKEERKSWFNMFKKVRGIDPDLLLEFHNTAGFGNVDYGVIMDRVVVKTTSITQIIKFRDKISIDYSSLVDNTNESKILVI
ncbi:NRDE family protein [Mangrovimonas aestuarii]|uniref:NRDE family protein n=1 Tax=Mangrovimonas aestuarii TaxID=3018443 RepID=UPI002378EDE6|nr:NRDE family protein [Mangrovimonas aestuarii]